MTKPILDFGFWIGRRRIPGINDAVGLIYQQHHLFVGKI
jgi:hypothetical protein